MEKAQLLALTNFHCSAEMWLSQLTAQHCSLHFLVKMDLSSTPRVIFLKIASLFIHQNCMCNLFHANGPKSNVVRLYHLQFNRVNMENTALWPLEEHTF